MDRMKKFFVKAWHDPVGSKFIYAGLAALGLWAKSGFSDKLTVIWASTLSIWTWLKTPTSMSVGVELLTLLTFAALYLSLRARGRRAVEAITESSAKKIQDASDANAREVEKLEDKLRACESAREKAESELDAINKKMSTLTPLMQEILKHLCNRYPTIEEPRAMTQRFSVPRFTVEKALLDMKNMGITQHRFAPYQPIDSGWTLTEDGLALCSDTHS